MKTAKPVSEQTVSTKKNLSLFTATSLDGEKVIVNDLNKLVGNALYFTARDISVLEKAKQIYKEQDFEVDAALIEAIRGTEKTIALWLIEQIVDFLQEVATPTPKPDAE